MNLIRQLRHRANVTQRELATRAGTSQSTVAAYEAGTKSPTLRTIQRFATSLDLELIATYTPRMTREDRRSLAFHRAIVEILKDNPIPVVDRARRNLDRLRVLHPHAEPLLARWSLWLELPTDEVICRILDPGTMAREMRQVSPFAGLLDAAARARVLSDFREEDVA